MPLWVASWGSRAGLGRVARLGDGWLASAYNTTPERFAQARTLLRRAAEERGRTEPAAALATMWTFLTTDEAEADRVLRDVLAPALRRDPVELAGRTCIGPPGRCAQLLSSYAAAGCSRVYFWPVADPVAQLHLLVRDVLPHVRS